MSNRRPRRADVDPPAVGEVLDELASARGWSHGLALAKLRETWESVVGPILLSRCEPGAIDADGTLTIRCDHGATANEITMLAATIASKANEAVPAARIRGVQSIVRSSGHR